MKQEITRLGCDNCHAIMTIHKECDFPYNKGWIYLHEINFRAKGDAVIKRKMLHFCSRKCCESYVCHLLKTSGMVRN